MIVAAGDPWVRWDWVGDHLGEIGTLLREHVVLTLWTVAIGLVIALPLGVLCHRRRALGAVLIAVAGVLYTVPALAAFALLVPWTGLFSRTTALVPLVAYSLFVLLRNVVTGLQGVPPAVLDAAIGLGYSPRARLIRVELPLALPAIVAGVRVATVTTIGLITITALIGQGGLGQLLLDAFQRDFHTPLVVGGVLTLALAVTADVLLVGVQRLLTPWARAR